MAFEKRRKPQQPNQGEISEQEVSLDHSNMNLLAGKNMQSQLRQADEDLGIGADDGDVSIDQLSVDKHGIHQKGNRYESSGLISGDHETDVQDDDKTTVIGDLGVDVIVKPIKKDFSELQKRIFENEDSLQKIEKRFYQIVTRRAVELAGITQEDEANIEAHRQAYEMEQIRLMEKQLRELEYEKIKLLKLEMRGSSRLSYKASVLGFHLDEIEAMYTAEARKRELRITKLYQRFNNQIQAKILSAEGDLQVIQRRRTRAVKDENVLFDGIRDRKLKVNWNQTPQPIVCKMMTTRCMRDKVPKGDYIIRATIMDRLVDNKLYYKFVEYGKRVKDQKRVDTEVQRRAKAGIGINPNMLNTNHFRLNKQQKGPHWFDNLPSYRTVCCCLSIKFGTYVTGILSLILPIISLFFFVVFWSSYKAQPQYYLLFAAISELVYLIPGIAFLIMLCDTTSQNRQIGFANSILFATAVSFVSWLLILILNSMTRAVLATTITWGILQFILSIHQFLIVMSYARSGDKKKEHDAKPFLTFSRCCLCVNLKAGAYIVGLICVFTVFVSVPFFVLYGLTMSEAYLTFACMCLSGIIPSGAYVWMLRDSINEWRRLVYAYSYLAHIVLSYIAIVAYAGVKRDILTIVCVTLIAMPVLLYYFFCLRSFALLDTQSEFEARYRKSLELDSDDEIELPQNEVYDENRKKCFQELLEPSKFLLCMPLRMGAHITGGIEFCIFLSSFIWFMSFGFTLYWEFLAVGIPCILLGFPVFSFFVMLADPNNEDKRMSFANNHIFATMLGLLGSALITGIADIHEEADVTLWVLIALTFLFSLYAYTVLQSYAKSDIIDAATQYKIEMAELRALEEASKPQQSQLEKIENEKKRREYLDKPLFESEVQMDRHGDDAAENRAVHWDQHIASARVATNQQAGVISTNMHQTKIGFDDRDFDELYAGKNTEKVWVDFSKGTTNVVNHDPHHTPNMNFNAHKMYFMLPPASVMQPSNVLLFELVFLSGKDPSKDVVYGWGALPIVSGDFNINTGKFKVPLVYGSIDFASNKFKDLEQKYIRNVDEWLCNLYIDVRRIELFDFRQHEEKVEFLIPKKLQRLLIQQRNRAERVEIEQELKDNEGSDSQESDYSSDESEGDGSADEWDLGGRDQKYVDPKRIDFHEYRYCVSKASAPEDKQSLRFQENVNSYRRTMFILQEIVTDLGIRKAMLIENIGTLVLALATLWFRMFIHYVGQYFILKAIDAPVEKWIWQWYKVDMIYSNWNVYQEMLVVAVGPLSNTLLLLFFMLVCHVSNRWIHCFPVYFCKIIAWYGLLTLLDFALIAVVDIAFQDEHADVLKLYIYYQKAQSSGAIGFFITFQVYFAITIFNAYVFYSYIVFVHCDAKIEDIFLRITGQGKGYYIPDDNEVSWNYLRQTFFLGEINNNRVVVNNLFIPMTYSRDEHTTKSYMFQRFSKSAPLLGVISLTLRLLLCVVNEQSVTLDQVYYANQKGQILALDHERMNLFRNTNLHNIIEVSKNWEYKQPMVKEGLRRAIQRRQGVTFDVDETEAPQEQHQNRQFVLKRKGTINFLRNVIMHRVNIINRHETEYEDDFSEEMSDDSEGTRMRKRLRKQLALERQVRHKVKGGTGDPDDDESQQLSRDDQQDDWNNFRTGGEVQLEKVSLAQKAGTQLKPLSNRQDIIE